MLVKSVKREGNLVRIEGDQADIRIRYNGTRIGDMIQVGENIASVSSKDGKVTVYVVSRNMMEAEVVFNDAESLTGING